MEAAAEAAHGVPGYVPTRAEEAAAARRPLNPLARGHAIMDKLRKLCDSLDTTQRYRSPNQVLIQSRLCGSVARLVYGANLAQYEKAIIEYNGFTTIQQETATTMPRRSGKSQSVAEWIACAMLSVPGFDGACFTNSKRASSGEKGMMGTVRGILESKFGVKLSKRTEECIEVMVNGDKRRFSAYPGSTHSLRGVGGNVIIVDEASYVTGVAFREAILPMLNPSDTCMILLSTLGAKSCTWFNMLIEQEIVDPFSVRYVCPPCYAQGERKPCIHEVDNIPHWGDEGRVAKISKIYGEANQDVFMREAMGIVGDHSEGRVFAKSHVMRAYAAPRVEFHRAVHRVFIAIDPIAGSFKEDGPSQWVAIAACEPYTTLLGAIVLDATSTQPCLDELERMIKHIRTVDEYLADATIVLGVEAGTGFSAPDVYDHVQAKFTNVIVLRSWPERKQGLKTDEKAKMKMVELTAALFAQDQFQFWKHFYAGSPPPNSKLDAAGWKVKVLETWRDQMLEFRRICIPATSLRMHTSFVLTGKGEDRKGRDDVAMATLIFVYMRYLYDLDPDFDAGGPRRIYGRRV